MDDARADVTQALHEAASGNPEAAERLWTMVYGELGGIARRELRRERHQTLSTTGLVHEAYFKFADRNASGISHRRRFYALACKAMRQIPVDQARARHAQQRGAGHDPVSLHSERIAGDDRHADLLALDDALDRLAAFNPRLGQVVECHFFGGRPSRKPRTCSTAPFGRWSGNGAGRRPTRGACSRRTARGWPAPGRARPPRSRRITVPSGGRSPRPVAASRGGIRPEETQRETT